LSGKASIQRLDRKISDELYKATRPMRVVTNEILEETIAADFFPERARVSLPPVGHRKTSRPEKRRRITDKSSGPEPLTR